MLCDGGIHLTRLLQFLLHREILLNPSIITITIATRLGVIVNIAIIMVMIIVGRDRTGRG